MTDPKRAADEWLDHQTERPFIVKHDEFQSPEVPIKWPPVVPRAGDLYYMTTDVAYGFDGDNWVLVGTPEGKAEWERLHGVGTGPVS